MRTLLAALTALMLFATPVVAENWEDAAAALDAGDYQKAFQLFKPLAEQGFARAQNFIGLMYTSGRCVPVDDAKAVSSYRKAAEQADAEAQNNLGLMYANGEGVLEDYVQAHAWWSIAATWGMKMPRRTKDPQENDDPRADFQGQN